MLQQGAFITSHLEAKYDLLRDFQLRPDAANEPCAPTFEKPCCVSEEPVQATEWIGIIQRATPGKLDGIEEAGEFRPNGTEMKSFLG